MTTTDEQFGLAHGYAPVAHRVACLDFDGTLYPFRPLFEQPDPLPGAPEAVRRLKDAGYRIVIFTSRLSPTWLESCGYTASEQLDLIEGMLRRDGIPFDDITAEKVPAEVYVDDRAIRFRDGEWPAIVDWVLFSASDCE